ncbi:hypothetical protein FXO38_13177 [Capsicum annuum]|nr:hypothetical protein FXO38_13177 [Capsicum annuum]
MLEFAIVSGLKCTGNIDDYMYTSSSKSALMSRYFPDNKGAITHSKLITRVKNGKFDNAEDALNLAILFFIHTFMFSQHKEAPISVEHFLIIEDDRIIPPWKILMKAGFESPVSLDQPLKKRKTVIFDQEKQAEMDDDTSGYGHEVHHGSDLYRKTHKDAADKGEIGVSEIQHHHHVEINVSPQSHQHKFVPSSSTQPEGTSKSSLDDVNAVDKDAGHEDNFENEDCSDLHAFEDVNLTAKEDVTEVNLKNQKSTEVTDVQDEVGGTINDSIQSAIDTLLFGLSTPSITKSLDVGASNKMTERHWDLSDSHIPPDFPDAQVRKLQIRKKEVQGFKHLDVIFYHLRTKLKIQLGDDYRYTMTSCFFKTYVEKTHTRYYPAEPAVDLSTQQDYAESIVVAKNEDAIANIIQGFCTSAGLPWYMVDGVYVPINCDNGFYDKTERTDWPSLEAYKGKITQQTGLVNEIPFDVDYV